MNGTGLAASLLVCAGRYCWWGLWWWSLEWWGAICYALGTAAFMTSSLTELVHDCASMDPTLQARTCCRCCFHPEHDQGCAEHAPPTTRGCGSLRGRAQLPPYIFLSADLARNIHDHRRRHSFPCGRGLVLHGTRPPLAAARCTKLPCCSSVFACARIDQEELTELIHAAILLPYKRQDWTRCAAGARLGRFLTCSFSVLGCSIIFWANWTHFWGGAMFCMTGLFAVRSDLTKAGCCSRCVID